MGKTEEMVSSKEIVKESLKVLKENPDLGFLLASGLALTTVPAGRVLGMMYIAGSLGTIFEEVKKRLEKKLKKIS